MTTTGRVPRILMFAPLFIAGFALFVLLVRLLWNWLMPPIFHLPAITYWQALGVLVLSKIIFGFGGGGGYSSRRMRRRVIERWESMTPEEREKFRQGVRGTWFSREEPPC